jgi:hypothetical protein
MQLPSEYFSWVILHSFKGAGSISCADPSYCAMQSRPLSAACYSACNAPLESLTMFAPMVNQGLPLGVNM